MKPIHILAILWSLTLAFESCTTDIDLNLKEVEPELVVNGAISTDTTTHRILLTKTANYFSNRPAEGIHGALVTVNDGTSTVTLTEDADTAGLYRTPSNYYGVVGKTYTLSIENVDINGDGTKETYQASSKLFGMPPLEQLKVLETKIMKQKLWAIKATFQDPARETNYYLIKDYVNGKCVSDSIYEYSFTSDEIFNGVHVVDETMAYLSDDKKDEQLKSNDVVTLEMYGITEDYIRYLAEVLDEYRGRSPLFGGQPCNIRSNVSEVSTSTTKRSARGYFAAYSVRRISVVYHGE